MRSATTVEAATAPCKSFEQRGRKGSLGREHRTEAAARVMLQAAAGRGARAWCILLDACEAEVNGRDGHT